MAVEIIKNQPVSFHVGEDDFNTFNKNCTQDNIDFCQSVRPGDTTMFQMLISPLNGNNLITNGDFATNFIVDGTWFSSDNIYDWGWGTLEAATTATVGNKLQQNLSGLSTNTIYRIKWSVERADDLTYVRIVLPSYIDKWGDTTSPLGETGTFTTWINTGIYTNFTIGFEKQGDTSTGRLIRIDDVEMLELSSPTVYLADSGGNNVLNITDIEYYDNYAQATFDWPDITEGKYTICVEGIDDLDFNYLDNALCIGLENGAALLQENGYCIKWFG